MHGNRDNVHNHSNIAQKTNGGEDCFQFSLPREFVIACPLWFHAWLAVCALQDCYTDKLPLVSPDAVS